ncbi:MAG: hypothetical protein IT548_15375 [Alphaproteobacteria bacterium]|nr:hypothetical protein [Alphaproteobacteria bacterium]
MQDEPTPIELLDAVITYLRDELMPELSGRSAFLTRVSANACDIVRRHLENAAGYDAAEMARLTALLKTTGTLEELNRELCTRIEQGAMTLDTPGLTDHLWATTIEKVSVDQPQYAPYRRALKTFQAKNS